MYVYATLFHDAEGDDWSDNNGVDFSISCGAVDCVYLARENTTVAIPCGKTERAPGVSFIYHIFIRGSQEVLETTDFARFNLSWNDNGSTVCCAPNTSSHDSTCYTLNVACKQAN